MGVFRHSVTVEIRSDFKKFFMKGVSLEKKNILEFCKRIRPKCRYILSGVDWDDGSGSGYSEEGYGTTEDPIVETTADLLGGLGLDLGDLLGGLGGFGTTTTTEDPIVTTIADPFAGLDLGGLGALFG